MGSTTWPAWLRDRGASQRVSLAGVSAGFFDTLGVAPALGRAFRPDDDVPNAPRVALLSYFAAMKIGLTHGRLFNDRDDRHAPRVALVSESAAHRLWPGQDAVGKRLLIESVDPATAREWRTIVGVVNVMAPWRFSAWTFGMFAAFAFGLACIGLFGVVALDVGSRRHELALRLAAGAGRVDLLRCVLVPAAWKVLIGAALGVAH